MATIVKSRPLPRHDHLKENTRRQLEAALTEVEEEARLLGTSVGSPVLHPRRPTFRGRGQPVESAVAVYQGDVYRSYTRMVRNGL